MPLIPVNEPLIKNKEIEYVNHALKTGWISSSGSYIKEFEKGFACYIGRKYGVAVNNGTNALILAIKALGIPEGSEVIIPAFTIISCALACIYNNLIPVFVDSEEDTWNMDISKLEKKISKKTKAIMIVHTYGHPVDVDVVNEIARRKNIFLIEDFAEAIGSEYKGKKCGGFGDISCVSFYANKTVTTGEGGMCLTDNKELAEKMGRLRNLGFLPDKRFLHFELGFNFRMTNIQAAIGCGQLERIEEHIRKKIWIGKRYTDLLKEKREEGLLRLPIEKDWAQNTYWMYGIVLSNSLGKSADKIMNALSQKGIQTRPFFYPLHLQPAFKGFPWFYEERLDVSESLYKYGFYLPSGLTITEKDMQFIVDTMIEILEEEIC